MFKKEEKSMKQSTKDNAIHSLVNKGFFVPQQQQQKKHMAAGAGCQSHLLPTAANQPSHDHFIGVKGRLLHSCQSTQRAITLSLST